jgi:hypothetical protein
MLQTKVRSSEQYPKISICAGDLNLLSSEEEMVIKEDLLQPVEDHDLGFTQVDRQLTKVTKEGHGIKINAVYVVSGKVSARVQKRSSRRHRRNMSENVGKTSKKYKNNHFFQFLIFF